MGLDLSRIGGGSSSSSGTRTSVASFDFEFERESDFGPSFSGGYVSPPKVSQPKTTKPKSSSKGFPERIEADDFFGHAFASDLSVEQDTGTLRAIENLALAPARVQEMPVSTWDVIARDLIRGIPFVGKELDQAYDMATESAREPIGALRLNAGSSPADVLGRGVGKIPLLGDVLRGTGELFEESSKVGPAAVNAGDLQRLRLLKGKPDNMLLVEADPNFLTSQLASPLGLLGRALETNTTVGDFRREMAKRGFLPKDLQQLEAGEKGEFDFGDRASSSNPLVSIGQSLALDPTNALLIAGPARLAKAGANLASVGLKPIEAGIGLLPKMEKIGVASSKAVDKVTSAVAIARGNPALATAEGLAHYIGNTLAHPERITKPYTAFAASETAAVVALDTTTDWFDDLLPEDSPAEPLLRGLHELSSSIINRHPMSDNATFAIVAAFHFPVRDFVPGLKRKAKLAIRDIKGGDGAEAALAEALITDPKVGVLDRLRPAGEHFVKTKALRDRLGGEGGVATLINYIDLHIARRRINESTQHQIRSLDSAAQRGVVLREELDRMVDDLRARDAITNRERVQTFRDWFGEQSGAGETGVRQQWDPNRALDHWTQTFIPMMRDIGTVVSARGEAVVGLEWRLTKENISDIKDILRTRRTGDTVPLAAVRDVFERYPQILSGIRPGGKTNRSAKLFRRKGEAESSVLAEYLVPDAKDPTWDSIRKHFDRAEKRAPSADELVHESAAVERSAPPPTKIPREPDGGGHREITPEYARDVLGMAEPNIISVRTATSSESRIPHPAETAPIRAAQDAAQGADAAFNQTLDAEAIRLTDDLVDWQGSQVSRSAAEEFQRAERALKESYPGYTIKPPPKLAVVMKQSDIVSPQIATQVLRMNGLFETLRYSGPFSGLGRALDAIVAPVPGTRMREDAKQAIMNGALPRGATPEQIERITAELIRESREGATRFGTLAFGAPWEMQRPSKIEAVAQRNLTPETYARIRKDYGGFTRLIDRSFNRFIQKQHQLGREGGAVTGRLGRALEAGYGAWQNTAGRPLRYVKAVYPVLRFMASPRYWAMNMIEADMIGQIKYGSGVMDRRAGLGALVHEGGKTARQRMVDEASIVAFADSGQPLIGRPMGAHLAKSFDNMSLESARDFLDSLPTQSREHAALVRQFGPNEGTWAEQINKMLYDFDTKGVKGAVDDTAAAIMTPEEIREMAPVMQRLYEINDGHYKAMVGLFEGNHSRSNVERVMNSYFLYWPLTYQLKAGKWLWDVMTERAFGRKTNFGGAYAIQNIMETHKEHLVSDPEYAQTFEDNETAWFAAQMIFPITPLDIGVGLSRATRYAGEYVTEGMGRLGWWGEYQASRDPLAAANALLTLGPYYDIKLLQRIFTEAGDNPKKRKQPPRQIPSIEGTDDYFGNAFSEVPPTPGPVSQPAPIGG